MQPSSHRVREHAVDHAFVDVCLAEPLGGEPGVVGRIVARVVLVEVVEHAREAPQVLVLPEAPREPAHHPSTEIRCRTVVSFMHFSRQSATAASRSINPRHRRRLVLEQVRHARQDDVRLEQEQALHERSAVEQELPPLETMSSGINTITIGPRLRREPTDLLQHRTRQVPERCLDDVERDPRSRSSTHQALDLARLVGIEPADRARLRCLERLGVVHRALGRVVHRRDEGEGDHPCGDQRTVQPGCRLVLWTMTGTSVTTMLGSRSSPALRRTSWVRPRRYRTSDPLHHLGDDHVDEVLGRSIQAHRCAALPAGSPRPERQRLQLATPRIFSTAPAGRTAHRRRPPRPGWTGRTR